MASVDTGHNQHRLQCTHILVPDEIDDGKLNEWNERQPGIRLAADSTKHRRRQITVLSRSVREFVL